MSFKTDLKEEPKSAFHYGLIIGTLVTIVVYYLITKLIYVLEYAGLLQK